MTHGRSVKTSRPSSQARSPQPDACPKCGKDLAGTAANKRNWGICWPKGGGCGYGVEKPKEGEAR